MKSNSTFTPCNLCCYSWINSNETKLFFVPSEHPELGLDQIHFSSYSNYKDFITTKHFIPTLEELSPNYLMTFVGYTRNPYYKGAYVESFSVECNDTSFNWNTYIPSSIIKKVLEECDESEYINMYANFAGSLETMITTFGLKLIELDLYPEITDSDIREWEKEYRNAVEENKQIEGETDIKKVYDYNLNKLLVLTKDVSLKHKMFYWGYKFMKLFTYHPYYFIYCMRFCLRDKSVRKMFGWRSIGEKILNFLHLKSSQNNHPINPFDHFTQF